MDNADGNIFSSVPANELAEVLDIILWDMSNPLGQIEGQKWLAELLARPDFETAAVQAAIAVMLDYLTPKKDAKLIYRVAADELHLNRTGTRADLFDE